MYTFFSNLRRAPSWPGPFYKPREAEYERTIVQDFSELLAMPNQRLALLMASIYSKRVISTRPLCFSQAHHDRQRGKFSLGHRWAFLDGRTPFGPCPVLTRSIARPIHHAPTVLLPPLTAAFHEGSAILFLAHPRDTAPSSRYATTPVTPTDAAFGMRSSRSQPLFRCYQRQRLKERGKSLGGGYRGGEAARARPLLHLCRTDERWSIAFEEHGDGDHGRANRLLCRCAGTP
jgi:hypothetical protein